MKFLVTFCFIVFSTNSFAWECRILELQKHLINELPSDGSSEEKYLDIKLNTHLRMASNVILGKVISGKVNGNDIQFELDVIHSFKGNQNNISTIMTSVDFISPKISLGENYLMFLYGANEVDFCSIVIGLSRGEISIDLLEERLTVEDYYRPEIKQILNKVINYEP